MNLDPPPWVSISLVWALPLPSGVLRDIDPDAWTVLDPGQKAGWDLQQIDTSWRDGRVTPATRNRVGWFGWSRVATAVLAEESRVSLAAAPGQLGSVHDVGVVLDAMELREHVGDTEVNVLCLHLHLTGEALRRPAEVAQLLRRPSRISQLRGDDTYGWQGFSDDVDALLERHGIAAKLQGGGYLRGGSRSSREVRPLVLSHLVPRAGVTERPRILASHDHWQPDQAWGWTMASGANAELYFRLPPNSADAAASGTAWIGHTLAVVDADGLSLVATRPGDDPSVENVDTQLLLHGRFLDLAVLALRQQSFLERHANRLARTASTWGGDDAHDDLGEVIEHEERLLRFRNRLWFTSVPNRPEGTTVLQLMQHQYGSPALMAEVGDEQADMVRILELRDSRRRRQAGERAEAERRAQTELNERQQAEQEKTRRTIETGVAILTPPAVICGLAALLFDPSPGLFFATAAISLLVVVGALVYLRAGRRR